MNILFVIYGLNIKFVIFHQTINFQKATNNHWLKLFLFRKHNNLYRILKLNPLWTRPCVTNLLRLSSFKLISQSQTSIVFKVCWNKSITDVNIISKVPQVLGMLNFFFTNKLRFSVHIQTKYFNKPPATWFVTEFYFYIKRLPFYM